MASISWMKRTTASALGLKTHLDNEWRLKYEHGNEDINKEMTQFNYYLGAKNFDDGSDKLKKRIDDVDKTQPPLKLRCDRKTCVTLEVPCPQKIADQGKADDFFKAMHELYKQYFGEENVIYTAVHKDEVHDYIDAKTGKHKKSLQHAHSLIVAYTPEKGVNCDNFFTRARIIGLNDAADRMCYERYGVRLNTGELSTRDKTEKLKIESGIRDAEEKAKVKIAEIERRIEDKQRELEVISEQYNKAVTDLREVIQEKADAAIIRRSGERVVDPKIASELDKIAGKIQRKLEQSREVSAEMTGRIRAAEDTENKLAERIRIVEEREKRMDDREKSLGLTINEEAQRRVEKAFRGEHSDREKRLESFCDRIKMNDGRTALEWFNEREKQLEKDVETDIKDSPRDDH